MSIYCTSPVISLHFAPTSCTSQPSWTRPWSIHPLWCVLLGAGVNERSWYGPINHFLPLVVECLSSFPHFLTLPLSYSFCQKSCQAWCFFHKFVQRGKWFTEGQSLSVSLCLLSILKRDHKSARTHTPKHADTQKCSDYNHCRYRWELEAWKAGFLSSHHWFLFHFHNLNM